MFVKRAKIALSTVLSLSVFTPSLVMADVGSSRTAAVTDAAAHFATKTPIRHLVVIYQENVSFDHYFATYPFASNPTGEPSFKADAGTPTVNNLRSQNLLTTNPNTNTANGTGAALPFRLDRTQASSADQNHSYTPEQEAYDDGKADLFPLYTGTATSGGVGAFGTKGQVMGYYDGNTVTAMWRYAQQFAMSDNMYSDTYGPSTPGALEVVSGQTNGMKIVKTTDVVSTKTASSPFINDGQGGYTMVNDMDPGYDTCSSTTNQTMMTGKNVGDLLNAKGITWGGFMGGFDLTVTNSDGTTGCSRATYSTTVAESVADYIPHHNWFQYFASTANPTHARPTSTASIGYTTVPGTSTVDPANHEYDLNDFYKTVKAGNFPAVSFIKMPAYQDAHAGYSDPLDEQVGVVKLVNFLQKQPGWADTAVVISYDDSDGWYDHAYTAPKHGSFDSSVDQLNGSGVCGTTGTAPEGVEGSVVNGRCGPGTRIPLILISPWAKKNYVDHTQITQSSVARFIEDNWLDGKRLGGGSFDATAGNLEGLFDFKRAPQKTVLLLDPNTGVITYRGDATTGSEGNGGHGGSPYGNGGSTGHNGGTSGSSGTGLGGWLSGLLGALGL